MTFSDSGIPPAVYMPGGRWPNHLKDEVVVSHGDAWLEVFAHRGLKHDALRGVEDTLRGSGGVTMVRRLEERVAWQWLNVAGTDAEETSNQAATSVRYLLAEYSQRLFPRSRFGVPRHGTITVARFGAWIVVLDPCTTSTGVDYTVPRYFPVWLPDLAPGVRAEALAGQLGSPVVSDHSNSFTISFGWTVDSPAAADTVARSVAQALFAHAGYPTRVFTPRIKPW